MSVPAQIVLGLQPYKRKGIIYPGLRPRLLLGRGSAPTVVGDAKSVSGSNVVDAGHRRVRDGLVPVEANSFVSVPRADCVGHLALEW